MTMTITVGERERSELKAAMARARAHPVPWEVLKRRITEQDGPNMGHVEDQPVAHERPAAEFRLRRRHQLRRATGRNVLTRIGFGSVAESGAKYGDLRDDI
jgi:hypothetical protein